MTNTFQAVIVTDEVRSYAIFNYDWLGWTTHTEAGGDTSEGQVQYPFFKVQYSMYILYIFDIEFNYSREECQPLSDSTLATGQSLMLTCHTLR